jgi:hypothetical protein
MSMAIKKKRQIKYQKIKVNKKWLIIGAVLWIISFFIDLPPIIFLSIFCVANAILLSVDRYVNAPVDLELSTFSAILMTKVFSLQWGVATGILTKIAAIIHNKNFTIDHIFMMGGYVIAAFMANMIQGDILIVGILATIVVNIYVVFVSKFITMLSNYEIIMYGSTNTIFNTVLFIGFSQFFYKIMMIFQ